MLTVNSAKGLTASADKRFFRNEKKVKTIDCVHLRLVLGERKDWYSEGVRQVIETALEPVKTKNWRQTIDPFQETILTPKDEVDPGPLTNKLNFLQTF